MTAFHRLILAAALCLPALSADAQHAGHGAAKPQARSKDAPSTAAFRKANDLMHKQMNIAYSGDADVDFIRGMIPHHQGAIDMARIQIAHGKDPAVRRIAEKIVADQQREIAEMKEWLARRDK
jgi:uncharacterized protein (DUF305 family)